MLVFISGLVLDLARYKMSVVFGLETCHCVYNFVGASFEWMCTSLSNQ